MPDIDWTDPKDVFYQLHFKTAIERIVDVVKMTCGRLSPRTKIPYDLTEILKAVDAVFAADFSWKKLDNQNRYRLHETTRITRGFSAAGLWPAGVLVEIAPNLSHALSLSLSKRVRENTYDVQSAAANVFRVMLNRSNHWSRNKAAIPPIRERAAWVIDAWAILYQVTDEDVIRAAKVCIQKEWDETALDILREGSQMPPVQDGIYR